MICITFQNFILAPFVRCQESAKEEKTKGNILGIPNLFLAPVGMLMTWEVLHPHPFHPPALFLTFLELGQWEGLILARNKHSLGLTSGDNICRAGELTWGAQCASKFLWIMLAARILWGPGIPLWALALFSLMILGFDCCSKDVKLGNKGSYLFEMLRGLNGYASIQDRKTYNQCLAHVST